MPTKIRKLPGRDKYKVRTPGSVKAKATTKKKAESQRRLLEGIERGWRPTGAPTKKCFHRKRKPAK